MSIFDLRRFTLLLLLAPWAVACGDAGTSPGDADEAAEREGLEDGPAMPGLGKADGPGGELGVFGPLPADADLDLPFQALFAPDDPNEALEYLLIQRVVDARKADSGPYEEGQNPYRIRYAVYNLSNENIVHRLADAEDAGVDVQILMDAQQLNPDRTWNTADEYFVSRGWEFVPNRDPLSAKARQTADLIGVRPAGLMHLKARIFETPDTRVLLTGSQNPGNSALINEETLHLVRDERLVDAYAKAYDEMLQGKTGFTNTWRTDAAVNVLFTPAASGPRAVTHMLRWLEEENEQILLMVFSMRELSAPGVRRRLSQILADKVRDGVPVYVITDRKQSDGVDADGNRVYSDNGFEDQLRDAGVTVVEAINRRTPFTAMHHKVAILGRSRVRIITDAANWSYAALGSDRDVSKNVESVLFIDSEKLDAGKTGRRYLAQWLRVLSRYNAESVERDGGPSFEEVQATLTGLDGWPQVPVVFEGHEIHTSWGEVAEVRGDHAALGAWDAGVPLYTDAELYPSWSSAEAPVKMPVGTFFKWKLVSGSATAPRWETGGDRMGFAQSTALLPVEVSRQTGTWR